ncbi:MAG: ribbon-helix-helix domain-containing protein, partial [Actinobacteria bacterium]|nr:ribbon-helix-helix domain-containing protein [Actinomycetota bacterium]
MRGRRDRLAPRISTVHAQAARFIHCYTLSRRGGPPLVQRTSKVLSVSVPPDLARDFERLAEQQGGNKSELFREMLRVYQAYQETGRFEILQRYGAARARA